MGEFAVKPEAFLPFLIFLAVGVAVYIFAVTESRKWQRRFETIAAALGGEIAGGRFLASRYVRTINSGLEQRVRVMPKTKNRPSCLSLEQLTDLDFDLAVTTENFINRGLQKLGVDFEVKVGDPVFDDKYFITSRAKDKAQVFLLSSERRLVMDAVFKDGFNSVNIGKGMIIFEKPFNDQDLEPVALKKWLDLLRKFTTGQ